MSIRQFSADDLHRILIEGAGEAEGVVLGPDTVDMTFDDLGYESIALLETGSRIEREFDVRLSDEEVLNAQTPSGLVDAVNARLRAAAGATA
jgi:minimal PKS acyl carrier protein